MLAVLEVAQTVVKRSEDIEGWMLPAELDFLRGAARDRLHLLEVGTWYGRSAAAICEGMPPGAVLTCLDNWVGCAGEPAYDFIPESNDQVWRVFNENHAQNIASGRLVPIRCNSDVGLRELATRSQQFDFVFIDADHSYEGAKRDIELALKLLSPGGLLFGHDYSKGHAGVIRAVSEAFPGRHEVVAGTIWHATLK